MSRTGSTASSLLQRPPVAAIPVSLRVLLGLHRALALERQVGDAAMSQAEQVHPREVGAGLTSTRIAGHRQVRAAVQQDRPAGTPWRDQIQQDLDRLMPFAVTAGRHDHGISAAAAQAVQRPDLASAGPARRH